jgi:hypothetical protein
MYLRCLSVSGQGKQKWSDMRERAIKWDGKQKDIDDINMLWISNKLYGWNNGVILCSSF